LRFVGEASVRSSFGRPGIGLFRACVGLWLDDCSAEEPDRGRLSVAAGASAGSANGWRAGQKTWSFGHGRLACAVRPEEAERLAML